MKVRFTQSYRGYKRGDVVEVTARLGQILAEHGVAVEESQQALPATLPTLLPVERAEAAQGEIRKATTR